MKKGNIFKNLLAIILIAVLFFPSCKPAQKSGSQNKASVSIDKDKISEDVREFVYPLPTSFEVTEMLNEIGAAYILTLSNETTNVKRYLTEKSKALNLGIYSADLSYASTYNQKQATTDYINVSKILIDALNISAAIDANIIKQIEDNQDDKEKLTELITNTFYDTYEFLNKNGRSEVSMLIVAGAWVEGLYIITHISEDTYNDKEMVKLVMEQKASLNKLVELLKVTKEDKATAETLKLLKPVKALYDSIEDGAITENQLNEIKASIYSVREEIIQ